MCHVIREDLSEGTWLGTLRTNAAMQVCQHMTAQWYESEAVIHADQDDTFYFVLSVSG